MAIDVFGLLALLVFVGLLLLYAAMGRRWPVVFRPMPGFEVIGKGIERAVEAGERVHLSLGTGSVPGKDSAPALAGLAVLSRVAAATTMSDKPAVVTAGDGALAILAQDTLRAAYDKLGARERYEPTAARMLGPSPFSYVASLPMVLASEDVSIHILIGSFGAEGALAAVFGERRQAFVLAGTDDIPSQALLYAVAQHPLIGEEVYAGGAYLNVGELHRSSLRAQDVVRALIVGLILAGTLVRTIMDLL
jgi:hypothetical protein